MSANVKLSETPLSKIIQSGGFLGKLHGQLSETDLPRRLAKTVLITFGLTASALGDAGIHKKNMVQGTMICEFLLPDLTILEPLVQE